MTEKLFTATFSKNETKRNENTSVGLAIYHESSEGMSDISIKVSIDIEKNNNNNNTNNPTEKTHTNERKWCTKPVSSPCFSSTA